MTLVLEQCGHDVEATIRRLDELSLSRSTEAREDGTAGPSNGPTDTAGTPRVEFASAANRSSHLRVKQQDPQEA